MRDTYHPTIHLTCLVGIPTGLLEFGALDDSIQILEPNEEAPILTQSREDFWRGFSLFLSKFSSDLMEEKFIRKYPSRHLPLSAPSGTLDVTFFRVLRRIFGHTHPQLSELS